jgi:hypothetical protein
MINFIGVNRALNGTKGKKETKNLTIRQMTGELN